MSSGNIWLSIATIVGAIISAIGSGSIVNYIQNHRKTNAETKQIEEDIISKIRSEGDQRYVVMRDHAELQEYKFDQLLEEYLELIERIREKGASSSERLAELRAGAMRIKYIDRIPGREPPAPFKE